MRKIRMVNEECTSCKKVVRVNYFDLVYSFQSLCVDCKNTTDSAFVNLLATLPNKVTA